MKTTTTTTTTAAAARAAAVRAEQERHTRPVDLKARAAEIEKTARAAAKARRAAVLPSIPSNVSLVRMPAADMLSLPGEEQAEVCRRVFARAVSYFERKGLPSTIAEEYYHTTAEYVSAVWTECAESVAAGDARTAGKCAAAVFARILRRDTARRAVETESIDAEPTEDARPLSETIADARAADAFARTEFFNALMVEVSTRRARSGNFKIAPRAALIYFGSICRGLSRADAKRAAGIGKDAEKTLRYIARDIAADMLRA